MLINSDASTELGIAKKRGRPKKVDLKYDVKPLKKSKRSISKIEGAAFNHAAWGHEPTWDASHTKDEYESALGFALNWYSVNASTEKQKKWTLEYLPTVKFPSDSLPRLASLPDNLFTTLGALARIAMRGAKLSQKHLQYIIDRSKELIKTYSTEHNRPTTVPAVSIRKFDTVQRQLIEAVETTTDEYIETRDTDVLADFDFPQAVRDVGASASQVRGVLKMFDPRAQELQQTLSGDKLLREAYSHMTSKQIAILSNFYSVILKEGLEVAPSNRGDPAQKNPDGGKNLRKFQHLHSSKEFKIESIDPKDILGADELWIFNTKTRKLGFFKATENEKLSVKGTSIINYNEEKSFCKTLRKPAEMLPQVKSLSKPATKKYVTSIRSKEQKLRSRINGETLLLRSF